MNLLMLDLNKRMNALSYILGECREGFEEHELSQIWLKLEECEKALKKLMEQQQLLGGAK